MGSGPVRAASEGFGHRSGQPLGTFGPTERSSESRMLGRGHLDQAEIGARKHDQETVSELSEAEVIVRWYTEQVERAIASGGRGSTS